MDLHLTDDQRLLRDSVREFAEREIRPHVMAWDEAQHFPMALLPKLADLGLMGIQFPEALGGSGMSAVDYCLCIEELARVDPAIALSVAAHNGLAAAHIHMFGSEAQQQEFLVPLATGQVLGAWGLTEPTAGSDAAGHPHGRAARRGRLGDRRRQDLHHARQHRRRHGGDGGHGSVAWQSRHLGVRRSRPARQACAPGARRTSSGCGPARRAKSSSSNCRVPADALLGEAGQGFINTLQVLDAGRIGIAALSVGLAQGAYDAARAYALQREQFGQPIASFQGIRWKLADLATKIDAARLLTYRAAALKDAGVRTTRESSMAKLYASEVAVRAAEECVQIHGGYGFVKDYPAEKYFRDVKLLTIGEGTSEVQRLVIARQLLA